MPYQKTIVLFVLLIPSLLLIIKCSINQKESTMQKTKKKMLGVHLSCLTTFKNVSIIELI